MFGDMPAFSGFSVNDLAAAQQFYVDVLGLKLLDENMGLNLGLDGGGRLFIYEKSDHVPASFTVLNFIVPNIDEAVSALREVGVEFQRYKNINPSTDIARGKTVGQGPDIAWFTDPAGNILAVIET